jgi:hypothetical protein
MRNRIRNLTLMRIRFLTLKWIRFSTMRRIRADPYRQHCTFVGQNKFLNNYLTDINFLCECFCLYIVCHISLKKQKNKVNPNIISRFFSLLLVKLIVLFKKIKRSFKRRKNSFTFATKYYPFCKSFIQNAALSVTIPFWLPCKWHVFFT